MDERSYTSSISRKEPSKVVTTFPERIFRFACWIEICRLALEALQTSVGSFAESDTVAEELGYDLQLVLPQFIVNAPGSNAEQPGGLRLISLRAPHGSFERMSFADFHRPGQIPTIRV